ncbi:prepilin-type N-terminal cleavage/methylation domain-containing protein [Fimbriimonadia bacterium ATM]|nr:MAG: prepilin-type N-terminal cleavage/methylation domain-containing protein [Armatimonadota bacterium]MBC6970447.1 prepilin-type N-terminal cleavage/methylation domain-containing protein [Armatimonadota bacterium]MCE7899690.1 prepilin-type N-terminal cleavage/methylation domain-containing protein [Armatimonadetes bacterium ATM1]MDL1927775.1 prepilin-type N-terminal cleavage/methylation domain-containing protein [Fimbriimonadia bacterium ATM]RIJ95321.1 MAG: hypothetical protein DCC45_10260 [
MRFHNWLDRRDRGVTLVEVMVVVAILTLLAGLMFGVIGPARRKASQMQCLSNIRQVGQALLMYSEDYSGVTPVASLETEKRWPLLVSPYGATKAVACPRFTRDAPEHQYRGGHLGYAMNACIDRLSRVQDSSRTVLITDVAEFFEMRGNTHIREYPLSLSEPDIFIYAQLRRIFNRKDDTVVGDYGAVRHNGGAIYALYDGSAKWHRPEDVVRYANWHDCYPIPWPDRVLGRPGGPKFIPNIGDPGE